MKLQFVVSNSVDPFWNVSVENYMVSLPDSDTVIMYLWKNRRTVVIGRNQNPFSECNVDMLLGDGGHVMRRTTGGGAVYHDDGNINFSFVAPYGLYDQSRQFEVISRAVASYGLRCSVSGRNDMVVDVDGQLRKFSGNAFSKGKCQRLHHGTLLIKSNMDDLQRYLKVKLSKLQKHGVASVQSRVVNLSELADITSENIVGPLRKAFEEVYGEVAKSLDFECLMAEPEVRRLHDIYSSEEWLYGNWRSFTASRSAQFDWGAVDIQLVVDQQRGIITNVQIASDALDLAALDKARRLLTGADTKKRPQSEDAIVNDILSLVY